MKYRPYRTELLSPTVTHIVRDSPFSVTQFSLSLSPNTINNLRLHILSLLGECLFPLIFHAILAAMALLLLSLLLLALTVPSSATYCICKDGVSDQVLQKTLDYACGAGADCSPILQNGACYQPNTVKNHCDYAVNSYFQRKGQATGSCDFSGTATPSTAAPTQTTGCVYPSSASTTGGTSITPSTSTTPTTTPSTTTSTTPTTTTTATPSIYNSGTGLGPTSIINSAPRILSSFRSSPSWVAAALTFLLSLFSYLLCH